ncbi:MAG: MATE family efflux transporter [Eubacteriales bacterium]|jgi:putative MATE family efflux protein|nr:MATE family efflux transporter [Eubacteriales bacterium]
MEDIITIAPARANKMAVQPEGKLLFGMGAPLAVSMLVQAVYNIVDSIFVSYLGESALTAISLSFPIFILMISVAVGTGIGINSLISRRLGAKRHAEAEHAAGNGLVLMLISMLAFVLFGIFATRPFMRAYTDVPQTLEYGVTYLSIITTCSVGLFMQIYCERILQSQGKNFYVMLVQISGAVFNIVFDPILIFGLFGFPKLGMAGAAIATVGGQTLAMLISFILILSRKNEVRLRMKHLRPSRPVIRDIYAVGMPTIVLQALGTVMALALNGILIAYTETAVAVFVVYFRVQSIALMPLFGMTSAAMSIIAFNYGAQNKKRVMRTWKLALITGIVMTMVMMIVFLLLPDQILGLFNATGEMLRIGRAALSIIPIGLVLASVSIVCSVLFQAIGKGSYSMYLSLMRQLFVLIPVAWLLSKLFHEVTAVWWAFPVAEVFTIVLALLMLTRVYNERIRTMPPVPPI